MMKSEEVLANEARFREEQEERAARLPEMIRNSNADLTRRPRTGADELIVMISGAQGAGKSAAMDLILYALREEGLGYLVLGTDAEKHTIALDGAQAREARPCYYI